MDLLQAYTDEDSDEEKGSGNEATPSQMSPSTATSLRISQVNLAPAIPIDLGVKSSAVQLFDPKTKELVVNAKYEELFQPESGPSNPFKSEREKAKKNMLSGYVEPAHFNRFHFDRAIRSYDAFGFAQNPSEAAVSSFVGDARRAAQEAGGSESAALISTELNRNKPTRKRVVNYDASDVNNYTGPWARYEGEETVSRPEAELQQEMDEIVRKRKLKSRAGRKAAQEEQHAIEESSTLHIREGSDYQGRSWMEPPKYTGANLRADYVPDRCYPPTKQAYTYQGHTKAVNAIRWFPQSAHLFLSCSMDNKVKLWEVYSDRKLVRTYSGHKMPVKDICFNNDGTEFLSASFDNHIKLWDTETGKVKNRFHTGHRAYVVKFNPDEDKQNIFLSGMNNKKVIQWDTRTGDIVQEYDRHLAAVNTITFFDKNRRFCTTSDDKSLRIWEWGIPVDTKLIQNPGLHSLPAMTSAPSERWIVGQSMDNRIVLFQIIDDKLKFAKKKAFRGHNTAGYACAMDFSPEMSFLTSGDADGKVYIWDWHTHKIVSSWKAHDNVCIACLWHPHEKSRMLSAGWDGTVKMWF